MIDPTTPEVPVVRFIIDEPADKDSFTTHSVLASAMAQAILTNSRLKVVGLLGRWGSGKSTVIQYFTSEIENRAPGQHKVFTYDAWLHQDDHPRRTFLENLVFSLRDHDLISSDKWETKLKFLSGQLEQIDNVEVPVFTRDAKFLFLALLPVPVGLSLISVQTIAGTFGAKRNYAAIGSFWLAVALIAFPFVAWGLRVLYLRLVKGTVAEWFPPFLINHQLERNSTLTERSPEPDSLEFGRNFQELMIDVSKSKTKLIIVIDNIDRIDGDDALELWANIRSFFLASHRTDTIGHESFHPIVILPVDDHAIRKLLEAKYASPGAANSFMDKTFDASFTVTEPVMSDWRTFMADQLQAAFGSAISDHDIFVIRRFLEGDLKAQRIALKRQTTNSLTPREINRTINAIVSLFLQWNPQGIDIISMAYFVIFRDQIEADVMKFVLSNDHAIASMDGEWQEKIAAMHYGVSREKAAQVLIEEPLIEAINRHDEYLFKKYSSIPGFGDVLTDLLTQTDYSATSDAQTGRFFLNAADLLAGVADPAQVWVSIAWESLGRAIAATIGNLEPTDDLRGSLDNILPHLSRTEIGPIASAVSVAISGSLRTEDGLQNAGAISAITATMIKYCSDSGDDYPKLTIRAEPAQFLRVLATFADDDNVNRRLVINAPDDYEAISEELVDLADAEATASAMPSVISTLLDEGRRQELNVGEVDWSALVGRVDAISSDRTAPLAKNGIILEVLVLLAEIDDTAVEVARRAVDEGRVSESLNDALVNSNEKAIAAGYGLLIWREREVPNPESSWRSTLVKYPDLIEDTILALRRVNGGISIHSIANSYAAHYKNREFLSALMVRQIEDGDLGELYPDVIAKNFFRYSTLIPYRLENRFIEILSEYEDFEDTLRTAPWGDGLEFVANHLLLQGDEKAEEVASIIVERLSASDGEDIQAIIGNGESPFPLIMTLQRRRSLNLTSSSKPYRALESSLTRLSSSTDEFIERWFALLDVLLGDARHGLVDRVAEAILASERSPSLPAIVEKGNKLLMSSVVFASDPTSSIEKVVLPAMRSRAGRAALKKHKKVVGSWASNARKRSQTRLRKRLETMSASSVKECKAFARWAHKAWLE